MLLLPLQATFTLGIIYLFIYFFKRILFVKKNVIMKNENEYSI